MTILTLTKTGALRLPKDILKHLGNPKHLQIRMNSSGATLSPVQIHPTMDKTAFPEGTKSAGS